VSDASLAANGHSRPRPLLYPERTRQRDGTLDRIARGIGAALGARLSGLRGRALGRIVSAVDAAAVGLDELDEDALRQRAIEAGRRLRCSQDFERSDVGEIFALVREASGRLLGMRHHDVQLIGGYALLCGTVAEMETGEGKTLTATLAAITSALAGEPVHVVTVNDYLAKRDAGDLGPLYAFFGLRVGLVIQGMERSDRRQAYASDVTYCTNKELAFDYLKDRILLAGSGGNLRRKVRGFHGSDSADQPVLQGLTFAIVDEADSVFVDEARTPLIISGQASAEADRAMYEQAFELGQALTVDEHFRLELEERRISLTPAGKQRVAEHADVLGGPWTSRVLREELANKALTALYLFHRDEHYLVRDDKVQIIDEYTGRVMEDRFWSQGLHQIIELKEGCPLSDPRVTLARMTYQRFFRRYRRLSGMTGTAAEIIRELLFVYDLPVVRIPTHRPNRRLVPQEQVFRTREEKWTAIVAQIDALHRRGAPVLLGTRTVAESEYASARLSAANLPHRVLNAAQDAEEAAIVADGGKPGRITVATNMAGRGTDIKVDPAATDLGGLHVIMSERHEASRIDRQLAGRCARQGQPGMFQAVLSLDDAVIDALPSPLLRRAAVMVEPLAGAWIRRTVLRYAQKRLEALHGRMRRDLLKSDEVTGDVLAFTGQPE